MRKFLAGVVLGCVLALGGCANNPLAVHQDTAKLVTPQQKAQAAVDQANATIAAAARTLVNGYQAGVYTKDEAKKLRDDLVTASNYVDKAEDYGKLGDLANAQTQLQLASTIVDLVQAQLIKAKNGAK